MKAVTLRAHYDGEQIRLDEPFRLEPDTPLTVTVLSRDQVADAEWTLLSAKGLEGAYGDSEPDYSLNLIRDPNPDYEGG